MTKSAMRKLKNVLQILVAANYAVIVARLQISDLAVVCMLVFGFLVLNGWSGFVDRRIDRMQDVPIAESAERIHNDH